MTTATAPAALTDAAFLGLAFGGVELAERPGDLFDTFLVRKVSADALAEAVEAVGEKITKRLPDTTVHAYVDDVDADLLWCAEHRGFADADRTRCPEAADRARYEYVAPCTMYPARAATVEVRVEGLPMWGEWAVGGILTRDEAQAVVATTVGAQRGDDTLFAHRYSHLMGECVHCGLNRRRNTTVLLVSDVTGEVRPVGKSCLAEYTGSAIRFEALAAMTSLRERFAQEVGGFLTAEDATAPTAVIVALALRYIALDGRYIKVNDCDPRAVPTASKVRGALMHSDSAPRPAVMACDLTDADLAAAAADIELVMAETTDSDYVLNLQAVAAADWAQITGKRNRVGLLASLPTAATRIRERAARDAAKAEADARALASDKPNRWIETPGKRRNFVGTIVVAKEIEVRDDYSYSGSTWKTMLVIDTAEGTIKVFGNVNWPAEAPELDTLVGKPIDLTGSIPKERAFEEYRGVKQTKVQRVRVAHVG